MEVPNNSKNVKISCSCGSPYTREVRKFSSTNLSFSMNFSAVFFSSAGRSSGGAHAGVPDRRRSPRSSLHLGASDEKWSFPWLQPCSSPPSTPPEQHRRPPRRHPLNDRRSPTDSSLAASLVAPDAPHPHRSWIRPAHQAPPGFYGQIDYSAGPACSSPGSHGVGLPAHTGGGGARFSAENIQLLSGSGAGGSGYVTG